MLKKGLLIVMVTAIVPHTGMYLSTYPCGKSGSLPTNVPVTPVEMLRNASAIIANCFLFATFIVSNQGASEQYQFAV
jgi:hypothetical protein